MDVAQLIKVRLEQLRYEQRDLALAVQGYCVDVCPGDAIRMDTGIVDAAAYSRGAMHSTFMN